ncbi:hypothetical protein QQP08_003126 [Theobroma cacao]|nr:hypothetical protein QQP08_003126 [Theobroma cacao]
MVGYLLLMDMCLFCPWTSSQCPLFLIGKTAFSCSCGNLKTCLTESSHFQSNDLLNASCGQKAHVLIMDA